MDKFKKYAFQIAKGVTFEVESLGQDCTICGVCGENLSLDEHEDDCLTLQARKELGEEWIAYVEEEDRKNKEEIKKKAQEIMNANNLEEKRRLKRKTQEETLGEKIKCPICKKKLREGNLKSHQELSMVCQSKIK